MGFHVGLLGSGAWARVHLAALAASPHVARVTLAGRNATALAQLAADFPIVQATEPELRRVIDDPSVDLVDLVLPHHLHAATTVAALSAGKHVICEKPAATTLAEFDAACAAAQTHGRRLLVVMNQLYQPPHAHLRELVEQGVIGRPFLSVENSFANARARYQDLGNWRHTSTHAGGGVLIDGGFHMVYRHFDTLAQFGPPTWVLADAPQLAVRDDAQREPAKAEDFVSITVGYAQPLRIQWAHGWTLRATPERARQSFLAGTAGTLELTDRAEAPLLLHLPDAPAPRVLEVPGPTLSREATLEACLTHYLAALAAEREVLRAPLSLARQTLATILAAYDSSRQGRRVALGSGVVAAGDGGLPDA